MLRKLLSKHTSDVLLHCAVAFLLLSAAVDNVSFLKKRDSALSRYGRQHESLPASSGRA